MKKTLTRFLLITLALFSSLAMAAPQGATANKGYLTLENPQPVLDGSTIEVIEFFWYGCPHCYELEPLVKEWHAAAQDDSVSFKHQPMAFNSLWEAHAKAYFTAEILGALDQTHTTMFETIHKNSRALKSEKELFTFFSGYGFTQEAVAEAYHSFAMDYKVKQAKARGLSYGITGVPAIVVNGKYLVSGKTAGSHERMIEVVDELIKKEKEMQAK